MKPIVFLMLMVIALPLGNSVKFTEPKVSRDACSQKTFDALCVPRVKTVQTERVNWI